METKTASESLICYLKQQQRDTCIFGIVRSVSSSGMSRRIDFYVIDGNQRPLWITPVVRDLLELTHPEKGRGVRVVGIGMDMIFHCVFQLGEILFDDGYYFKSEAL